MQISAILWVFITLFSVDVLSSEKVRTFPLPLATEKLKNHRQKGIEVKGIISILVQDRVKPYSELSGLAWDADDEILYAVSDKGYLNLIRPILKSQQLIDADFIANFPLREEAGKALGVIANDSEGISLINSNNGIVGDTELVISFERIPRIMRYSSDGQLLEKLALPDELEQTDFYDNSNSALEAVEHHPEQGILVAAERLKGNPATLSIFNQEGKQWSFQAASRKYGSATGMTLSNQGNLIVLERVFSNIFMGVRFAIHHLILSENSIKHERLAYIGQEDGLFNDNFEGITHHQNNHFFMIADDNRSSLQRGLIVYFSIPALNKDLQPHP